MELPYETQGEPMPAEKRAALDAIEEIAERAEYKLQFKLQPGDMLLVQRLRCMHKRSGFIDHPDPKKIKTHAPPLVQHKRWARRSHSSS